MVSVIVVSSGRSGACRSRGRSSGSHGSSRSSIASVVFRFGICLQRLLNKAKSPAKKKDLPGKSPSKVKKDKRARSDSGDKRQDRHDRHDRHDKHDKRDKHDKHDKHDKLDKHGKHEKSGKHDKHDRYDRQDNKQKRRREDLGTIISMGTGGGRGVDLSGGGHTRAWAGSITKQMTFGSHVVQSHMLRILSRNLVEGGPSNTPPQPQGASTQSEHMHVDVFSNRTAQHNHFEITHGLPLDPGTWLFSMGHDRRQALNLFG
jgi:hypothetical protein